MPRGRGEYSEFNPDEPSSTHEPVKEEKEKQAIKKREKAIAEAESVPMPAIGSKHSIFGYAGEVEVIGIENGKVVIKYFSRFDKKKTRPLKTTVSPNKFKK